MRMWAAVGCSYAWLEIALVETRRSVQPAPQLRFWCAWLAAFRFLCLHRRANQESNLQRPDSLQDSVRPSVQPDRVGPSASADSDVARSKPRHAVLCVPEATQQVLQRRKSPKTRDSCDIASVIEITGRGSGVRWMFGLGGVSCPESPPLRRTCGFRTGVKIR